MLKSEFYSISSSLCWTYIFILILGFYFVVFDPSLEDCKEYRELHGAYCALVSFLT